MVWSWKASARLSHVGVYREKGFPKLAGRFPWMKVAPGGEINVTTNRDSLCLDRGCLLVAN